jgi:hypothetical protein
MNNRKHVLYTTLENWLPLAVVIVIFSGLIYITVQQNYRSNANDPQIQISEDIASAVAQGSASPSSIVPPNPTTDISASLSPFVAIYSASDTPIGSSVSVGGKLPTLPSSVFSYVQIHGEDRFTWEPQPGVRIAAVVDRLTGQNPGFVLAGRSLKEVEIRENQLTIMVAVAGILALVLTFIVIYLLICFGGTVHKKQTDSQEETPEKTETME